MIRDDTERDRSDSLRLSRCRACDNLMRYFMIDGAYCSYECAGVPVPDSRDHPDTCWTWDGKPKMGFPTQGTAERTVDLLGVSGVKAYYCVIHHFWHIGYSDARQETTSERLP
jgi:hypothetical protein